MEPAQSHNGTQEHNAYGAPPGTGISMPPYYLPTPSVKNRNNYFPQSEPLGADEMRIIFMGSGRHCWPQVATIASSCSANRPPASLSEPELSLHRSTAGPLPGG